jgi:hypothetical protein
VGHGDAAERRVHRAGSDRSRAARGASSGAGSPRPSSGA